MGDREHGPGALAGIRVLGFTRVVAGPCATMLLADHGSEVTKVEVTKVKQPGKGNGSQTYPPFAGGESTYFMSLNRNKKSIELDLKSAEGRRTVTDLLPQFDVLVHNFRCTPPSIRTPAPVLGQHNEKLLAKEGRTG